MGIGKYEVPTHVNRPMLHGINLKHIKVEQIWLILL